MLHRKIVTVQFVGILTIVLLIKPHPDWERIGEVFLGNKHSIATLAMQRMMIGAVARAQLAAPCPGYPSLWVHKV